MPSREHSVSRPPRPPGLAEPPATIEPRLRDIPEFPGPDLADVIEPFDGGWTEPLVSESFVRAAREAAFADNRFQELLGDRRHAVIGVSRRLDDKERREPLAVLVAYSYERGRTIEAWLTGEEGNLDVADVAEADYQPAPSDDELARAIELARSHERIAVALADDYEAQALLASDVEEGDLHHGTRRVVVGFGPADERQARVSALVDLGTEEVLAVQTSSDAPIGKEREE
jgi:hypothetical protein